MSTQRFTRDTKLIKTDEFSSVFNFKKRYHTQYFVLHYLPTKNNQARLGLVAGKKVEKSAVKRNYMRRVLRELFRTNPDARKSSYDFILRVQKSFNKAHFKQVEASFNDAMTKVQQHR